MNARWAGVAAWTGVWALLVLVALYQRPLLPIDETRYVSVAWEMWLRGDFLVPHINGEPYSHKPPLLFWLIQLGWAVFGVNDWWPRLVTPLFALAALGLSAVLARRLWPELPEVARLAPWVVLGSLLWSVYGTAALFDPLIAVFSLLGLLGIVSAAREGGRRGWLVLALAIGLGVLAKGPVILLYTLPAALLAPWWHPERRNWWRWYAAVLGAVAGGAAIAMLWALPAGLYGGETYRDAIFWGQTANRMVKSFAHQRPLWWYVPMLPVLLFPWLLYGRFWRGARALASGTRDTGARFCLSWMLPVFVAFSLISGKQLHYLVPLVPAFALLVARALAAAPAADRFPGRIAVALVPAALGGALLAYPTIQGGAPWEGIGPGVTAALCFAGAVFTLTPAARPVLALAMLSPVLVLAFHLGVLPEVRGHFDLAPIAQRVGQWQRAGDELAHAGAYNGQFHFLGRLQRPIAIIGPGTEVDWLQAHPAGRVITYQPAGAPLPPGTLYSQPFRRKTLVVLGDGGR